MKHYILLFSIAILIFSCGGEGKSSKANHAKEAAAATEEGKILWLDIEEIEERMKKEPKKVLVDGYTTWCGWCKRMDKATFAQPDIVKKVNEEFYAFKFNCERKDTINFKGQEFTFKKSGRKGYNTLAPILLKGKLSYPTISFLDEELNLIDAYPGAKTADKFDGMLTYVNENHYKAGNLQTFLAGYKTDVPAVPLVPKKTAIKK